MKKRVIGITGGVGTGKSTVLEYLRRSRGAQIIQADLVARELMEPGGSSYEAVRKEFGPGIVAEDGQIDRKRLAEIIFGDEEKRKLLNSLTHPLVKEEVKRQIETSGASLVVYEAALPGEAGMRELCGEIWTVTAPAEVRIRRLMADRGYSREKCLEIMGAQLSEDEFRRWSDAVIDNGGTPEQTEKELEKLLRKS